MSYLRQSHVTTHFLVLFSQSDYFLVEISSHQVSKILFTNLFYYFYHPNP